MRIRRTIDVRAGEGGVTAVRPRVYSSLVGRMPSVAVRPFRSLWLLCACLLLLPLDAAAGHRPADHRPAHKIPVVRIHGGLPHLQSPSAARLAHNIADDAEDDDFDASTLCDCAAPVFDPGLRAAPQSQLAFLAQVEAGNAGLRTRASTLAFVPRPPPDTAKA